MINFKELERKLDDRQVLAAQAYDHFRAYRDVPSEENWQTFLDIAADCWAATEYIKLLMRDE